VWTVGAQRRDDALGEGGPPFQTAARHRRPGYICGASPAAYAPNDDCVGVTVHDAVGVILGGLVHQLELGDETERRVAAARGDVGAGKGVHLSDERVAKVGHASLLPERPRLLDQVQGERAEHAQRDGARHKGQGN